MAERNAKAPCRLLSCHRLAEGVIAVGGVQWQVCKHHLDAYIERVYREIGSTPYATALATGQI